MTPQQRFNELKRKKLCFQCLLPGASYTEGRHREGKCQRDFTCKHQSHLKYTRQMHVLVCDDHKEDADNIATLQQYKERCILCQKQLPTYSKEIKLSFYTSHNTNSHDDTITDNGIYQLQTIKINNDFFTIFYDNGCGDFVSRKSAIDKLDDNHATQEFNGIINLGGVGGITTKTEHGIYTVRIPLKDGDDATMTGVCLDKITSTFPQYPLQGKVENDIHDEFKRQDGDAKYLPKLPSFVGGNVDFMIGIKYLRYHPKPIFQLPSGLTIFKSMFKNADGGCEVIGGPHEVFTKIEKQFQLTNNHQTTFLCNQLAAYRQGYQINPDVSMLGFKNANIHIDTDIDNSSNSSNSDINSNDTYLSRKIKMHQQAEEAGTVISYRCLKCRSCKECEEHDHIEETSIREEVEQDVINKSVTVDLKNRTTIASLPFIHDPSVKLAPNKHKAMKVFQQQLRKLSQNPKDKADVLKSEGKLQSLGHVDYISNLSQQQQIMLQESEMQNFIPWRAVWKNSSLSTPCRVVFDASQPSSTGYSLNNLLAKGRKNMNKLQEILLRWLIYKVAYHTDVRKMYNSIKLIETDWCYQRYIWEENLDPGKIPHEKVIKTLIYGVKSSGNQAEYGLRETAKLSKDEYPEICDIIQRDVYVDDCLSGDESRVQAKKKGDELEIVLNRGGLH